MIDVLRLFVLGNRYYFRPIIYQILRGFLLTFLFLVLNIEIPISLSSASWLRSNVLLDFIGSELIIGLKLNVLSNMKRLMNAEIVDLSMILFIVFDLVIEVYQNFFPILLMLTFLGSCI